MPAIDDSGDLRLTHPLLTRIEPSRNAFRLSSKGVNWEFSRAIFRVAGGALTRDGC
ncbi:UNVERIFIED_ORG: hypothetical protein M2328_000484 [Rhodococcus erythropolis]